MNKELVELIIEVGYVARRISLSEYVNYASGLETKLKAYIDSIQQRPDAERAALMLMSAGCRLYGANGDPTQEDLDCWHQSLEEAEKLLGIVPLEKAE